MTATFAPLRNANWISYQSESPRTDARRALSVFSNDFVVPAGQQLVRATLWATALGVYRGFVNGQPVTPAQPYLAYGNFLELGRLGAGDQLGKMLDQAEADRQMAMAAENAA